FSILHFLFIPSFPLFSLSFSFSFFLKTSRLAQLFLLHFRFSGPYNNGDRNFFYSSAFAASVRRKHFGHAAWPRRYGRVACFVSGEVTALCSFNFVSDRVCAFPPPSGFIEATKEGITCRGNAPFLAPNEMDAIAVFNKKRKFTSGKRQTGGENENQNNDSDNEHGDEQDALENGEDGKNAPTKDGANGGEEASNDNGDGGSENSGDGGGDEDDEDDGGSEENDEDNKEDEEDFDEEDVEEDTFEGEDDEETLPPPKKRKK
ncbi:hypothetical protein SDJN02_21016, partial [Cucurbita argyrosperma subsp. argyrosperma]